MAQSCIPDPEGASTRYSEVLTVKCTSKWITLLFMGVIGASRYIKVEIIDGTEKEETLVKG